MDSASALASSVLPTPVGPRNRKVATGLLPSRRPARDNRTASATARTASSWPTCSALTSALPEARSRSHSSTSFLSSASLASMCLPSSAALSYCLREAI
ncbi:Uncharacterised protein [Mycobacteroides abscessus subsp. abscessus]|nr:Uncharacterised protein [Mycobacteroides abscessus subsp. abscessus]